MFSLHGGVKLKASQLSKVPSYDQGASLIDSDTSLKKAINQSEDSKFNHGRVFPKSMNF